MESKKKRIIKSGREYDHLMPRPGLVEKTVKRGANVADTLRFIPKAVSMTRWQTEKLTNALFRGYDRMETCRRIWQFLYDHIPYKKDEEGREQIRSPRFSWYHRHQRGIDCDCYTTFISTILYNLGIPHLLRIARYKEAHFEHIYPIVPMPDGSYLTIDCVVSRFNYEEPYTEKKDTKMDLEFLDGINGQVDGLDDLDMLGIDEIEGLYGKKGTGKAFKKIGQGLKKGLHAFNRVNPATIALRNGLLAAMKLNTMNIAGNLKWTYLSEPQAAAKGIIPGKYQKLKKIRGRLEKIFHGAGGKEINLKKAILKGNGNKKREVPLNGLFGFDDLSGLAGLEYMDGNTPLKQLLGAELWESENIAGMEDVAGLEGFGELGAAAAIASTTGALTTIATLIKSVGNIFNNPADPATTQYEHPGEAAADLPTENFAPASGSSAPEYHQPESKLPATILQEGNEAEAVEQEELPGGEGSEQEEPVAGIPFSITQIAEFWNKNSKWLKPTLLGVGGLGLLYFGSRMLAGKKKTVAKKTPTDKPPTVQGLSGLKSKKKPSGGRKTRRRNKSRIKPINLM